MAKLDREKERGQNMNGISDATRKRLLDVVAKQDIEVDEMKVIMEHIDVKKPHHSSKFDPADYRPNARQKEMYINEIIYRNLDMNLDMASGQAFSMLTEFDVDDDKLEELEFLFIEAHTSLLCYRDAFYKLEQEIQS